MANFSQEEWAVIRIAPQLVSMAVAGAGGGIFGAIKEAMSAASAMTENAQSASAVVQQLCTAQEVQTAQQEVQQMVMSDPSKGTPEALKELAVQACAQAVSILAQRVAGDVDEYRTLVMSVGNTVSKAAKEGGFLGFGGELVSEGEQVVMQAVDAALRSGMSGGYLPPSRPATPQAPAQPSVPASPPHSQTAPKAPPKSGGMPRLGEPPPPPMRETEFEPPSQPAIKPQVGVKPKSGIKPKTTSKGGFRTGSGLRKSK